MKIVCDISEKDYNNIEPFLKGETINGGFNLFKVLEMIRNGTPLPEHHGDLIDRNELLDESYQIDSMYCAYDEVVKVDDIKNAPTIIEGSESE